MVTTKMKNKQGERNRTYINSTASSYTNTNSNSMIGNVGNVDFCPAVEHSRSVTSVNQNNSQSVAVNTNTNTNNKIPIQTQLHQQQYNLKMTTKMTVKI